jgi:hypothetical protein
MDGDGVKRSPISLAFVALRMVLPISALGGQTNKSMGSHICRARAQRFRSLQSGLRNSLTGLPREREAVVNDVRRAKIDVCVRLLLQLHKEVSVIHEEEDQDYLGRTLGSQATSGGRASSDAAQDLGNAAYFLNKAIESLDKSVGARKD